MSAITRLIKTYSGIFGHQVTLKNRRGKSIMTIPRAKGKILPSAKQQVVRERLNLAAQYAAFVKNDPALLARYTAKACKGKSVYRLAANDFLRPPYIHKVDTTRYHGNPGNKIIVTAGDDFKLESVTVNISNPDGTTIEEGDCVFTMPTGNYECTAKEQIPVLTGYIVTAKAKDTPGNITQLSANL
jgi:hypothetical protein